jgi:hypothetical protein
MKMAQFMATTLLLPTLLSAKLQHPRAEKPLQFGIRQGENQNWFFKNKKASVQLLVSSGKSRIIAAFPAQNSGIGIWFREKVHFKLFNPQAIGNSSSETVSFFIQSNQSVLTLEKILLDNVRILRGAPPETQAQAIREKYAKSNHIPEVGTVVPNVFVNKTPHGTFLVFERKDFKAQNPYRAEFFFPLNVKVEKTPSGWKFSSLHGSVSFHAKFSVPFQAMTPFLERELFLPKYRHELESSPDPNVRQALLNLNFLAFKEKFLAGGWQYLTYFGRDTAFTLFMLGKYLTPQAYETGLQSLLDRVSKNGEVAHEEDLGSLAQVEALEHGEAPQAHPKPFYDYTMVDETFLLPIVFQLYLAKVPPDRAQLFLQKVGIQGKPNVAILQKNFQRVMAEAEPFYKTGLAKDLVRIMPGSTSGNWRDSAQGLAFGKYPADVNCWLIPEALKSIGMAQKEFPQFFPESTLLKPMIEAWEKAESFFLVRLSSSDIRNKIKNYLEKGPFTPKEREYFLSLEIEKGTTVQDFLYGKTPQILQNGLTFPALSLDENGKPIPVMHSDPVFALFLNHLSEEKLKAYLPIFSLPYPIGLYTPVGLLSTNPAYASTSLWKALNADAYHGTVVWVWAQSMLRLGLAKQAKDFSRSPEISKRLHALENLYAQTEKGLGFLALSELYTWEVKDDKLKAIPYGERAHSQTEADAVQLWSSVLPIVQAAK